MSSPQTALIEGGIPLVGNVKIGGSRALAIKLIYASVLSGENCTLSNIPKADYVLDDLSIAQDLGVKTTWMGNNRLSVDSCELSGFEIPQDKGSKIATAGFMVPALIHKYGKAVLPKSSLSVLKKDRGVQYGRIWESLGMEVKEDFNNYYIEAVKLKSGEVTLPYRSRVLTDLAILSTLFVLGESKILNASMDAETDDLIEFCNQIGGNVKRNEDGFLTVVGSGVFKGVDYWCAFDREEAAFFIIAALLTNGNITLSGIEREGLLPFINWLSKVDVCYEFSGQDMRVWHNVNDVLKPTEINVMPHPGFITDFQPLAVFLNCFAQGNSKVVENLLANNLDYIKDLNRLGGKITVNRELETLEISISGPSKFKSGKISISDLRYALVDLLFGLTAEGKNELEGYEIVEKGYEAITERLHSLGASITNDL